MNATVNLSRALCPDYAANAELLVRSLYPQNLSFHDRTDELASYACQYGYAVDVSLRTSRYTCIGKWIAFVFGLVGSILALLTFSRKEYASCVTMLYHRAINAVEIVNALLTLQAALHASHGDRLLQYEAWAWMTVNVAEKLRNCLFCWVNLIVVWVSFERVLACLFVRYFDVINRRSVAVVIISVSGILATALFLPYGFGIDYAYDNRTAAHKLIPSAWSQTNSYRTYTLVLSILMVCHPCLLLVTSLAALRGLLSMTRRKRMLAKASTVLSNGSRELLRQCSLNIQLCVLQMCETIPCEANVLLFAYVTIRFNFVESLKTVSIAPLSMSYDRATENMNSTIALLFLNMINGFGVSVSHFSRFYWYLIFSPRVRRSFLAVIARKRDEPSTTGGKSPKPSRSNSKPKLIAVNMVTPMDQSIL